MRFWVLLFAACVLSHPVVAFAQATEVQEEAVPEPEADDSAAAPDEASAPKNKEEIAKEKAAKLPAVPKSVENGEDGYTAVTLQGLNKVTARAQTIEAPIGSVVRFGTIEIVAHSCWKSAPEDQPENAALLEISEIKQGEPPARIFLGWMFSSSPGLSALEHPFYDVTVVKCDRKALDARE